MCEYLRGSSQRLGGKGTHWHLTGHSRQCQAKGKKYTWADTKMENTQIGKEDENTRVGTKEDVV